MSKTNESELNDEQKAIIDNMILQFAELTDMLHPAMEELEHLLRFLAQDVHIQPHDISARVKSFSSYKKKVSKVDDNTSSTLKYGPDTEKKIEDALAARIIVFDLADRETFQKSLEMNFQLDGPENPGLAKHNGYDSDHYVLRHFAEGTDYATRYPELQKLFDVLSENSMVSGVEIQVRTVAGHAWAEYEHDIQYKTTADTEFDEEDRKRISQLFIEAGGVRKFMDTLFREIGDIFRGKTGGHESETSWADSPTTTLGMLKVSPDDLRKYLTQHYPDDAPATENEVTTLITQLGRLGWEDLSPLDNLLTKEETEKNRARMGSLPGTTAARRFDDDMLAALGREYVSATAEDDKRRRLALSERQPYLTSTTRIYKLVTPDECGSDRRLTARGLLREVCLLALKNNRHDVLEISGSLTTSPDPGKVGIAPSYQRVIAKHGDITVTANYLDSKEGIEQSVDQIWRKLAEGDVSPFSVLKAESQIIPSSSILEAQW